MQSYLFEWENDRTLQRRIRRYVDDNFLAIDNEEEGAGQLALEKAMQWTRETMEREGCPEQVIEQQCEETAVSILQFELFQKFLGDVGVWENDYE